MTLADVEIITPDGKFASIRVPTVIDAFASGFYEKDPIWPEVIMRMAVLCVSIDGERVTKEMLGNMPMYEFEPVTKKLIELITARPAKEKS